MATNRAWKHSDIDTISKYIAMSTQNNKTFYSSLSSIEAQNLIRLLKIFLTKTKINPDMIEPAHIIVHKFMCKNLISYELDFSFKSDPLRQFIEYYFQKLKKEMTINQKTPRTAIEILFMHMAQYPHLYIHEIIQGEGSAYRLSSLNLTECGCSNHHRILSDTRLIIEEKIISECIKQNKINSKRPLRVLSLGSGGGLQDFLIVYKLFSAGIIHIDISLIEQQYGYILHPEDIPINENENSSQKIQEEYYEVYQDETYDPARALLLLSRVFSKSRLHIHQNDFVSHIQKNENFDVIYAIDFENYSNFKDQPFDEEEDCPHYIQSYQAYKDFHALSKHLTPSGKAFLSYNSNIQIFEKENDHFKEVSFLDCKPVTSNNKLNTKHDEKSMQSFFSHRFMPGKALKSEYVSPILTRSI